MCAVFGHDEEGGGVSYEVSSRGDKYFPCVISTSYHYRLGGYDMWLAFIIAASTNHHKSSIN